MTELIEAARQARERAFAPYSRFRVGAALQSKDGQIITGCNVESASYGLTLCAERVAIVKAVSEGILTFDSMVIIADTENLTPPCGACRQLIWEFAPSATILLTNLTGLHEVTNIRVLLPRGFDQHLLPKS